MSRIIRYFIALVLLTTAIGKLLDNAGFAKVIESYQIFSGWITLPMGLAMSLTELGLSIWLFFGNQLHRAALASTALHLIFTGWAMIAIFRGLELSNCGCFGVFLVRPLGWSTVLEDSVMTLLSLTLYILIKHRSR